MIFSTEVDDQDFDGLLDVWETGDVSENPPSHAPLLKPGNGEALPDLYAMGAKHDEQDIFFQLAFMSSPAAYTDPLGSVVAHTHLPSEAVLNDIGRYCEAMPRVCRRRPAITPQTRLRSRRLLPSGFTSTLGTCIRALTSSRRVLRRAVTNSQKPWSAP